ncbi:hypothetical protein INT44_009118 [Umbelopsis vinacea]|uniref:ASX DEUBAD domain-containing protein n=1 Tax=Umbelopsis vinacea TaxID=44442 RepID=A0A8H7ULG1_9FUNG|nr:hypothetical protein INT44_009118 [Umbelopsis vinacea]
MAFRSVRKRDNDISPYHKPNYGSGYPEHPSIKKTKLDTWSLEYLLRNPESTLADIDLKTIICPASFQILPPQDRSDLLEYLPYFVKVFVRRAVSPSDAIISRTETTIRPKSDQETLQLRLDPNWEEMPDKSLWNDEGFFEAMVQWQELLKSGQFLHTSNDLDLTNDEDKNLAFDAYWGDLGEREKMHNVAGDSKNITLKDMCRLELIKVNDVLIYKRNFSASKVIVDLSMQVVKASGSSGLSIQLGGQVYEDFETPTALETKILDYHGRVTKEKRPNGNAFKSIRLVRNNKDMGRLFDIRKGLL